MKAKMAGSKALSIMLIQLAGVWSSGAFADQTNNWWLGGSGNWSNPANWSEGKLPDTNHIVRLGYDDSGSVPDTPQTIALDVATAHVFRLELDCIGSREVRLNGATGGTTNTVAIYNNATVAVAMSAGAGSDAFLDANIQVIPTGNTYFSNGSSQLLTFDSNCVFTTTGSFRSNGGPFRFRGVLAKAWRPYSTASIYFDGGRISGLTPIVAPMDIKVESDGEMGVYFTFRGSETAHGLTFQRVGAGNRTLGITLAFWGQGSQPIYNSSSWDVEVLENTQEEGHLTLRTQRWENLTRHYITDSNTTVEVYGNSALMGYGTYPAMVGPGDLHMAMDETNAHFTVQGRTFGHTGRTILSKGIMSLVSYTATANDVKNPLVAAEISEGSVFYGALSATSALFIASTAELHIADTNQVVDGLSGAGRVDLGGKTLRSDGGISPGASVGTLHVTNSGTLDIAGGTSVFEIKDATTFDKVVLPDGANVNFGGTLQVVMAETFTEDLYGDYTIFELTGGTASGSFAEIEEDFPGTASCRIEDNNVILSIRPPQGTMLLVL